MKALVASVAIIVGMVLGARDAQSLPKKWEQDPCRQCEWWEMTEYPCASTPDGVQMCESWHCLDWGPNMCV